MSEKYRERQLLDFIGLQILTPYPIGESICSRRLNLLVPFEQQNLLSARTCVVTFPGENTAVYITARTFTFYGHDGLTDGQLLCNRDFDKCVRNNGDAVMAKPQ